MIKTIVIVDMVKNGVNVMNGYKTARRLVAVVCLLALLGYAAVQTSYVQKKLFYPYKYSELVSEYSELRRLDEALVASVILGESKFDDAALSHKGAVGLMQIMPQTAEWIASQIDYEPYTEDVLLDPEVNIRFGTWYLASLREEFNGNEVLMLAAYNAGRGNVKSWMEKYNWTMEFTDIDQIPYKETRQYVAGVLKNKSNYQRLYGM